MTMLSLQPLGYLWAKERIITTREIVWECPRTYDGKWVSKSTRLTIQGNLWTLKAGFKYDGCSDVSSGPPVPNPETLPVKNLNTRPLGILWFACLIHDVGYHYLLEKGFPFTKDDIDFFLRHLANQARWKYSKLYYVGVSILGWGAVSVNYFKRLIGHYQDT